MTRRLLAAAALLGAAAASCPGDETAPAASGGPAPDPTITFYERRTAADPRDHLSATKLAGLRIRRAANTADPVEWRRAEEAARTALQRDSKHLPARIALARSMLGAG